MIKIFYIFFILLVNLISAILIGLRYRFVLSYLGKKISVLSSFLIFCISSSINYLIPFKGGILIGGPTAAKLKEDIEFNKSSVVLIFEQLFEIIWQLIFILIAIWFTGNKLFNNSLFSFIFITCSILVIIYFIFNYEKLFFILTKVHSFFPKKIKNIIQKLNIKDNTNDVIKNVKFLFRNKKFLLVYVLQTLIIIFETPLNLFLILLFYSFYINYFYILFIFWISFILGKLSGLPGGLGVRDLALGTILTSFNIPLNLTVKIVFIHRILSLFPTIPVGVTTLLYFGKGKIKNIYNFFNK